MVSGATMMAARFEKNQKAIRVPSDVTLTEFAASLYITFFQHVNILSC